MNPTQESYQPFVEKLKSKGIDTIFFDIGEVLVHVDKEHLIREIQKHSDLARETIIEHILGDGNMVLSHIGEISDEAYFTQMVEFLHFRGDWKSMKQLWRSMIKPLRNRTAEMHILKQHFHCGIISNITPYHIEEVEENFDFVPGCRWVIYSCDVGYVKPREEIFNIALEKSGKKAENCFYLDDRADNAAKAVELGFQTVQVFPEDDLRDCIERL